jgi:hypothetical protein
MFDPEAVSKKKEIASAKKKNQELIKTWVMELLPDEIRQEVEIIVCREFQCGDPKCAPIDTGIQVMFKDTKKPPLQTGLPLESHMVTREHVASAVENMLHPSDGPVSLIKQTNPPLNCSISPVCMCVRFSLYEIF